MIGILKRKLYVYERIGMRGKDVGVAQEGTLVIMTLDDHSSGVSGEYAAYDLQVLKGPLMSSWTWGDALDVKVLSPLEILALEAE
jgi:hypothetical protein